MSNPVSYIFKESNNLNENKKENWLAPLINYLETAKEEEITVPFTIIDIKEKGFLVKINDLFGYVPFNLMTWKYYDFEFWSIVFYALKDKEFEGKIIRIEKNINYNNNYVIYIDASSMQFKEIIFCENENYVATVLKKNDKGILIEIGDHFDWEYGSIQGIIPYSLFPDLDSFMLFEAGQSIVVNFLLKTDKRLIFKIKGYCESEIVVPFQIIDFTKNYKFVVKIKGMEYNLPVFLMPWQYKKRVWWSFILYSLKEKIFFGKIIEQQRTEKKLSIIEVFTNELTRKNKEVELSKDVDYEGIVLKKNALGILIDIGYHFNWECGSVQGFIPFSDTPSFNSLLFSDLGQKVVVNIIEIQENNLLFKVKDATEQEISATFNIISLKNKGFCVKINQLYIGYVPLILMPWKYSNKGCWNYVFSSLTEKEFIGKVVKINTYQDNKILPIIDATSNFFEEVDLNTDDDYKGIVLHKTDYGVFVDIGVHFEWKYGSLEGLVPVLKFPDKDTFLSCEPGQIIEVNFLRKNNNKFLFKSKGFKGLRDKFVGKNVKVKISKKENGKNIFLVEDIYRSSIAMNKKLYGGKKKFNIIKNKIKNCFDGEEIDCEVIDTCVSKNGNEFLMLKYLLQSDSESDLDFNKQYVQVKVCKNKEEELTFWINGEDQAKMPINKKIYGKKLGRISNILKYLYDGDVIECEIVGKDGEGYLTLKYIPKKESEIDWNSQEISDYIKKTVFVHTIKDDSGFLKLLVENKYRARFKDPNYENKKIWKKLPEKFIIACKVDSIDTEYGMMIIDCDSESISRCIKIYEEQILDDFSCREKEDIEMSQLINKTVQAKLCKKTDFLVYDNYRAKLPITKSIYGNKDTLVNKIINSLDDGDVIDCEVIDNIKDLKYKSILILKFIEQNNYGFDLNSQNFKKYIGANVTVTVHKTNDGIKSFVENKYPAIFHGDGIENSRKWEYLPSKITVIGKVISIEFGRMIVESSIKNIISTK